MKRIRVNTNSLSYDIAIAPNMLSGASEEIAKVYGGRKIAIITDEMVYDLHGERLRQSLRDYDLSFIIVEPGEKSKSLTTLDKVYAQLSEAGITRGDLIAAFGGGVVGDLAGFAASTYLRGVCWVQIPTTLLAQIDSSVGGKTAVNLPAGKNLSGTFWQPRAVITDTELLSTLSEKEIINGMGEVIKYACIEDAEFFSRLEAVNYPDNLADAAEDIINTCCLIKSRIVSLDERDTGLRMKLNFGHTLAHGIELLTGYGTYSHGHAVAIGMVYMSEIGEQSGLTAEGTTRRLRALTDKFGIDISLPPVSMDDMLRAIKRDKKNISGSINLVMLRSIGDSFINEVKLSQLCEYFQ